MTKHTKKGAGGKKPQKYGEKTTTVSFSKRIPESRKQEYQDYGNEVIVPLLDGKIKAWELKKDETNL